MELLREKNKVVMKLDDKKIGEITWIEDNNNLVVDHTFVDPAHRGKDYARQLVDAVVDIARKENRMIMPVCPYVVKVFDRHEKYHDIYLKDEKYPSSCRI